MATFPRSRGYFSMYDSVSPLITIMSFPSPPVLICSTICICLYMPAERMTTEITMAYWIENIQRMFLYDSRDGLEFSAELKRPVAAILLTAGIMETATAATMNSRIMTAVPAKSILHCTGLHHNISDRSSSPAAVADRAMTDACNTSDFRISDRGAPCNLKRR